MRVRSDWYRVESEKFINTDVLRFVASAGIVFYHYLPHATAVAAMPESFQNIYFNLNLFVEVFFVVSGFVIYSFYNTKIAGSRNYTDFIRKRVARLLPLHCVTLLFYVVLLAVSGVAHISLAPRDYDVACLPAQLTLTQAWGFCKTLSFNAPSWSISAEMAAYLLAPLLFVLGRRSGITLIAIAAFLVFGYTVSPSMGVPLLHQRTVDMGFLRAIPAFLFGIWLAAHPQSRVITVLRHVPLLLAAAIFVLSPLFVPYGPFRVIAAYLLAAIAFSRDTNGLHKHAMHSIAPLGRLTYSMYMLHLPIATIFVTLLMEKVLHLDGAIKIIGVAATAAIVLPIVSVLSLELFELPLRKIIAGGQSKPRTRPDIATEIAP